MTYESRDADTVREPIDETLQSLLDDPALDDTDIIGALAEATARSVAEQQEQSLEDVSRDATIETATGDALTRKAADVGVGRREAIPATGAVEFSRSSDATTDYTIAEGTRVRTADGEVTFETTEQVTLVSGTRSAKATVRATEGGTETNLAPNKLVDMPSPPSGIESVTNPNPTGDENYTDTNGETLVVGRDRENDEELRIRALQSRSIGGAATPRAIEASVLSVPGVRSVSLESNPKPTEDEDGRPPYSNEVIVAGGNEADIADALVKAVGVTDLFRLQSGVIGTGVTVDKYIDVLEETVSVGFSRPAEVSLTIDVTVDTTTEYVGDDVIANTLVEYVGGVRTDGETINGLGVGEDVYINLLEDAIVGTDVGVRGIDTVTVDTNGDGSDDRTTTDNGIEIIDIGFGEQATLDASDVTISTV
ncbi:baseplate J/gp47 family protein [Halorubrum ezzemoulense]|uniref:baseplate J/gp47 family protein n=1 Tax=Halorubrum ezzemoulense TaxID=337243 RepID=UPI00232CFDE5|nr:baseplate J/gp47 family protein [Halorubrum ezzemoulense]MDB9247442.1 baseplate J/gp47 family protein [Halorubrum ezzemoulense]MDB9258649.1 baseplate J/gp47 family protein [Halorubrum ezzemoulense]MDB9264493.1 baseplate J/gp47 family protein [Halorubrum ezzemoulense]MDB9269010.1 baseplate J/gp47 family protein [Halorubrum ezzemoulense]MDB9271461.1 baseplate J/gp47 family protein [Halorubrum ezzemoulense]